MNSDNGNKDKEKDEKRPASRYGNSTFANLLAAQDIAITPERSVQQSFDGVKSLTPPTGQIRSGFSQVHGFIPRTEGAQVVHVDNDNDTNSAAAGYSTVVTPEPKASEVSVPYNHQPYQHNINSVVDQYQHSEHYYTQTR